MSSGSYTAASTTAAHQHSAVAGDGGALSQTVTLMNTPTAQTWAIIKAMVFG